MPGRRGRAASSAGLTRIGPGRSPRSPRPSPDSVMADALSAAFEAYHAGRLDDAALRCEAALRLDVQQVDAWHLLAVIELQRRRATAGERCFRRALAIAPTIAAVAANH